jgi:hypothetical protein
LWTPGEACWNVVEREMGMITAPMRKSDRCQS